MSILRVFPNECRGVTSIEYAIITSLIAIALVGSFNVVGQNLSAAFASVAAGVGGSPVTPPPATPNGVHGGGSS